VTKTASGQTRKLEFMPTRSVLLPAYFRAATLAI
jgi:hypothetical protein